jgi:ABC-type sugar transport system permease subunit
MKRLGLGVLAYVVPTFLLGFVWHLVLFRSAYDALGIYRKDVIIPFGLLSMIVQGVLFAWIYEKVFARAGGTWMARGLAYAGLGALLSWSFTTIAVAAKNVMTSVPDYLLIETAFTVVQWAIVGPLTSLLLGGAPRKIPAVA